MRKRRPHGYRKDGTPIWGILQWAKLFENYPDYRRVAETILEDGTRISTVWLGLDHDFSGPLDGPNPHPIIFETMVFSPITETRTIPAYGNIPEHTYTAHDDWDQERYITEAEAIMGHDAMVRKWKRIREAWKNGGLVPEDSPVSYRSKRTDVN